MSARVLSPDHVTERQNAERDRRQIEAKLRHEANEAMVRMRKRVQTKLDELEMEKRRLQDLAREMLQSKQSDVVGAVLGEVHRVADQVQRDHGAFRDTAIEISRAVIEQTIGDIPDHRRLLLAVDTALSEFDIAQNVILEIGEVDRTLVEQVAADRCFPNPPQGRPSVEIVFQPDLAAGDWRLRVGRVTFRLGVQHQIDEVLAEFGSEFSNAAQEIIDRHG